MEESAMRVLVVFLCAVVLIGCSGRGNQIPSFPDNVKTQSSVSNRVLIGFWDVRFDPETREFEISRDRSAEMHLNLVRLLEVKPCTDCLSLKIVEILPDNTVTADVTLRHPYSTGNLKLSGFDVRGIFVGEADYTWPVSGHKMAVGDAVPLVINPDGYTSLFNPTQFPETSPPALGYIPGNAANGGNLTATLNPFIAFKKDQPRRLFKWGEEGTETIQIKFPDGPLEFGYAVDGCWQTFVGPCVDPITDFPPDANCLEAYQVSTWAGPALSTDDGAWSYVYVNIYDHQGFDTIAQVTAEIPGVISDTVELDYYDTREDGGFVFRGKVTNELDAPTGDYPFLARVIDTVADQNLGQIDAWCPGVFPVRNGYVMPWGEKNFYSEADFIAINDEDNIFVIGTGHAGADCDPSLGDNNQITNHEMEFMKFDWGGGLEWVKRIMISPSDYAIDSSGNHYITGQFKGTVDFDPGPGIVEYTSYYNANAFLIKLDPNGELLWVLTWKDNPYYVDPILAVSGDLSAVYMAGVFEGIFDFDPGVNVDEHTSISYEDGFLMKISSDSQYEWTQTWGCGVHDPMRDVVVDGNGNPIVCGSFNGIVDMDPGPGEEFHDSEIYGATFLIKLDSDGVFQWARSFSAYIDQYGRHLAVDSNNNIYLIGDFMYVVDFDPGTPMDVRTSNGSSDIFFTRYDPYGNYQWVLTWGGAGSDNAWGINIDQFDNVYINGKFEETVDMDPGPGIDEHTVPGGSNDDDVFMSRFTLDGIYIEVSIWRSNVGGPMAFDHLGNIYFANTWGYFFSFSPLDFDPGPTEQYLENNHSSQAYILKLPYGFNWW